MRNYFLGIENAILFEKIPSYFIGYNFYEVIQKNIFKYFEKITKNQNEIKPILLIGLYIIEEEFGDKIIFLPKNF
jgi:hypothetical protein